MSWLKSFEVVGSGLRAQRVRMEVAAQNLANADVARTSQGGPYKRKEVVLASLLPEPVALPAALGLRGGEELEEGVATVEVVGVQDDPSPPLRVYDPGHPDADQQGYVLMPNVQAPVEMADMMAAARAYEANAAALENLQRSVERALELLR